MLPYEAGIIGWDGGRKGGEENLSDLLEIGSERKERLQQVFC